MAQAAQYFLDNEEVYRKIETNDMPGADGISSIGNFQKAASGEIEDLEPTATSDTTATQTKSGNGFATSGGSSQTPLFFDVATETPTELMDALDQTIADVTGIQELDAGFFRSYGDQISQLERLGYGLQSELDDLMLEDPDGDYSELETKIAAIQQSVSDHHATYATLVQVAEESNSAFELLPGSRDLGLVSYLISPEVAFANFLKQHDTAAIQVGDTIIDALFTKTGFSQGFTEVEGYINGTLGLYGEEAKEWFQSKVSDALNLMGNILDLIPGSGGLGGSLANTLKLDADSTIGWFSGGIEAIYGAIVGFGGLVADPNTAAKGFFQLAFAAVTDPARTVAALWSEYFPEGSLSDSELRNEGAAKLFFDLASGYESAGGEHAELSIPEKVRQGGNAWKELAEPLADGLEARANAGDNVSVEQAQLDAITSTTANTEAIGFRAFTEALDQPELLTQSAKNLISELNQHSIKLSAYDVNGVVKYVIEVPPGTVGYRESSLMNKLSDVLGVELENGTNFYSTHTSSESLIDQVKSGKEIGTIEPNQNLIVGGVVDDPDSGEDPTVDSEEMPSLQVGDGDEALIDYSSLGHEQDVYGDNSSDEAVADAMWQKPPAATPISPTLGAGPGMSNTEPSHLYAEFDEYFYSLTEEDRYTAIQPTPETDAGDLAPIWNALVESTSEVKFVINSEGKLVVGEGSAEGFKHSVLANYVPGMEHWTPEERFDFMTNGGMTNNNILTGGTLTLREGAEGQFELGYDNASGHYLPGADSLWDGAVRRALNEFARLLEEHFGVQVTVGMQTDEVISLPAPDFSLFP